MKNNELTEVKPVMPSLEGLPQEVIEYVSGLVAENEILKSFIGGCYTFNGHIADESDLYIDALESLPETPNTDAAIAEIREQSVIIGIDFVRNMLIDYVEREVGQNKNVPGLIKAAEKCVDLAANLRAGSKG